MRLGQPRGRPIAAGAEIDRYCLQNDVPPRTKYRIRLAFEELAQQMLWPLLDRTGVRITVEYAAAEAQTTVTARYGGGRFDPAEGENELSYAVLSKSVEEMNYSFDPEREDANIIRVLIREKA